MKIHILTGVFYPEVHPRAFRATELAKEFAKQGHQVVVSCLTNNVHVDYKALENEYGLQMRNLALYTSYGNSNTQQTFLSHNIILQRIHRAYRFLLDYLLGGHTIRYAIWISKKLDISPDTDLFISSSTPFMNTLAGALYRKRHSLPHTTFVADCGDPFSGSSQTPRAIYMRWLEKWVLKFYNYLTIPTALAIPAYKYVISSDKIKIIPQGFKFEDTPLATYKRHLNPTFAYAGVFYKDIRNPQFILDYLVTYKSPFLFKMYLRHNDPEMEVILSHYKEILADRLQIEYGKDRASLIYELSQCDFLVHIGNTVTTQVPSKLIDYGISKRPIYSSTKDSFEVNEFEHFLEGDYGSALQVDINPYRIERVCEQFIQLHSNVICI